MPNLMVRYPYGPRGAGAEGMGDWKGDIAAAVAGNELNQLISGIFNLQNSLVEAINARNQILSGYTRAKAIYDDAEKLFGPPVQTVGFVPVPNFKTLPAQFALASATKGVRVFARQVQTLAELAIVFSKISEQLSAAYLANDANAVDMTVNQVNRFVIESDALFRGVPEYNSTKQKIIAAFKGELTLWGVGQNDYGDPRWFAAFVKAADKVVEIPGRPTAPQELGAGMSGMNGLGNPMPQLIIALLWVVAIAAATVTAMYAISKTISALNSEAETAKALILQRDREKEAYRAQLAAQGTPAAAITEAMKQFDAETDQQVKAIPKSALLGDILLYGGLAAGGIAAVFILPEILKKL